MGLNHNWNEKLRFFLCAHVSFYDLIFWGKILVKINFSYFSNSCTSSLGLNGYRCAKSYEAVVRSPRYSLVWSELIVIINFTLPVAGQRMSNEKHNYCSFSAFLKSVVKEYCFCNLLQIYIRLDCRLKLMWSPAVSLINIQHKLIHISVLSSYSNYTF